MKSFKKIFLSNIIFLVLINLLIKPFYVFVIEVAVQNKVGPAEYGVFFSLFNFCYLFQIFTDLGINNYNNTSLAKKEINIGDSFSKLFSFKIFLSLAFFGIICLVAWFVDYPDEYYPLVWMIAINQILMTIILFCRSNISALGFYKLDSIVSVLDKLLLILLLAYLLWVYQANQQFKISWFVYAQMASLIFTLAVSIILLLPKINSIRFPFSQLFDFKILKQSLPFAIIILVMSAYSRIDGVMLERMLQDNGHEAGIYAASYRILDALNIVGFLFAGLLLPMFSKIIGDQLNITPTLNLALKILSAIALSVALFCTFSGEEFLSSLYPEFANEYAANILILLTWGFVGISCTHIFGTLLTAGHYLKQMNVLFVFGLLINVILNWYFIPTYKAQAAATTTLITEAFVAIGLIVICYNKFSFKIPVQEVLNFIFFGLIMAGCYYLLSEYLSFSWGIVLILGILVSFMVSLLLNIIDIRALKEGLATR